MENSNSGKSMLCRLELVVAFIGMFAVSAGVAILGNALSQMRSSKQSTEAPAPNAATNTRNVAQLKPSQAKMPARKEPVRTAEKQSAIMPMNSTKPVNYPYQGDKRFPPRKSQAAAFSTLPGAVRRRVFA